MNCSSKHPATVVETARWVKIACPAALVGLDGRRRAAGRQSRVS